MALVSKGAAILVKDGDTSRLADVAIALVNDKEQLSNMSTQVLALAKPNASVDIAQIVVKLATKPSSHEV